MPKRASTNPSTPTKNKRVKEKHKQIRLDHFFSSPGKYKAEHKHTDEKSRFSEFIEGSSKQPTKAPLSEPEIIDVDALDLSSSVDLENPRLTEKLAKDNAPSISNINPSANSVSEPADLPVFSSLDVDPLEYSPGLPSLSSLDAPYSLLTLALISLSQTRSRISIINTLTNVLRSIISNYPSSLLPAVYLLSNSLGPQFVPIELGLGSSILTRSIQQISGLSASALRKLYNSTGDPGDVAYAAKSNIRTLVAHKPLTVPSVYNSMIEISKCKGQGAAKEKQKIVEKLLLAASGEEVRYLVRTLCQNLRVGAVRTSILTALARAFVLSTPSTFPSTFNDSFKDENDTTLYIPSTLVSDIKKEAKSSKGKAPNSKREILSKIFKRAEDLIKQVYVRHPNYDQIIPALLEHGLNSLAERVPLCVGKSRFISVLGTRSLFFGFPLSRRSSSSHAWFSDTITR